MGSNPKCQPEIRPVGQSIYKHCAQAFVVLCSNASKKTSWNSLLIIWTGTTWISEYWAKEGDVRFLLGRGIFGKQRISYCSRQILWILSESSSWTALISVRSLQQNSQFFKRKQTSLAANRKTSLTIEMTISRVNLLTSVRLGWRYYQYSV